MFYNHGIFNKAIYIVHEENDGHTYMCKKNGRCNFLLHPGIRDTYYTDTKILILNYTRIIFYYQKTRCLWNLSAKYFILWQDNFQEIQTEFLKQLTVVFRYISFVFIYEILMMLRWGSSIFKHHIIYKWLIFVFY